MYPSVGIRGSATFLWSTEVRLRQEEYNPQVKFDEMMQAASLDPSEVLGSLDVASTCFESLRRL